MSCQAKSCKNKKQQFKQTGGGSDFRNSAIQIHLTPDVISRLTLADIEQAPMFHPLEYNRRIPMGYVTTGIVPEGIYYMNQAANQHCKSVEGCTANNGGIRATTTNLNPGRQSLISELKQAMKVN